MMYSSYLWRLDLDLLVQLWLHQIKIIHFIITTPEHLPCTAHVKNKKTASTTRSRDGRYPQQHSNNVTSPFLTKEQQQKKINTHTISTQTPAYTKAHSRLPEEHERNRHIMICSQWAQESDCEQPHYKVMKTGRRKDADDVVLQFSAETGTGNCWLFDDDDSTSSSSSKRWLDPLLVFRGDFCRCCRLRRRTPCSVCIQYDRGSVHRWMTVAVFCWMNCLYHTPSPCLRGSRCLVPRS